MKLAIVGSRSFNNYKLLCEKLNEFPFKIESIVSGGAKGADHLGKRFAENHYLNYIEFKPDWDFYGKSAGYKRNVLIVNECDQLMAFWDGISKGTMHSISLAKEIGKLYKIILC